MTNYQPPIATDHEPNASSGRSNRATRVLRTAALYSPLLLAVAIVILTVKLWLLAPQEATTPEQQLALILSTLRYFAVILVAIAAHLTLERFGILAPIGKELFADKGLRDDLLWRLRHALPFTRLTNQSAVYTEATNLVREADFGAPIQATSFGAEEVRSGNQKFDAYMTAIGERMLEAKAHEQEITYELIVSGVGRTAARNLPEISGRGAIFQSLGVEKRLFRPKSLDTAWSIDVLIVNNTVIIGFPTWVEKPSISTGIKIEDAKVAQDLRSWFSMRYREATPVDW